ncbi:MAG: RagB/SusD family nutrient uptake outer membrane protein [Bacteroidales bacterium]|nr:RagB/SusD family nutrient uptake outer membrane protein [Bacteroidales bacterium]
MKRNIFLLIIISLLALNACEDYLDLNPLDRISAPTYWKKKADFDQALTAIYGQRQAALFTSNMGVWDCLTDNGYAQHESSVKEIVNGNVSPSLGGYASSVYSTCYAGIARINVFLKELAAYTGTDFTDAAKKQAEAEARFHRSYYYFQLYNIYGDVPLVLEPVTIETMKMPKETADKILQQALTDIDFAIANLGTGSYVTSKGRPVKTSAQALKARIMISEAYGNTGTPDIAMLTQVRDLCLEITGTNYYALSPVFTDVFQDKGQKAQPGIKEIIYSVNFLAPNSVTSWDLWYGDWIVASPLRNFVNSFECTDGLAWGVSPLTDPANEMLNRDPRLGMTVFKDKPDWGGGNVHNPTNARPTTYGVKKFLCPENVPYGYTTLSQQNAVILRLGEVLLMYAEAQNEIAGPDATVYQAMTDLRARVGMPPFPDLLTKDEMRERIRHERRIELAFEGLRYFDLKRWRIAGTVLNAVTDGIVVYKFLDKHYKWPLPQTEIDRSGGELVQNPDYL